MFNSNLKKEALAKHKEKVDAYNKEYKKMETGCMDLYENRQEAVALIQSVEDFINSIANSPKEFAQDISTVKKEKQKFKETESYAKEAYETALHSGVSTAAGIAGGTAVAALGPTAAMWVATTFGTASTGTAISALSGAAATNAALAWLGGGATYVGGAGIVGGKALLALAGPIGWGIAGIATGVSVLAINKKNKKIAEKAMDEAKKISEATVELSKVVTKVMAIKNETKYLCLQLKNALEELMQLKGANYMDIPEEDKMRLGALVNNTLSLATLLNKVIA